MQPLFTIHAGEYLVGSHIEQHLRDPNGDKVNVWVPSKDTGIDLLVFTMFLCVAIPYLSPYVFGRLNSKLFMISVSIVYSYLHFKNLSIGSQGVIPYATIFS